MRRGSSFRFIRCPTHLAFVAMAPLALPPAWFHLAGCGLNGVDDVLVAGAAAEVAGDGAADFGLAVEQNRAGAAERGLAADVGAGQAEEVAEVMHEQQARLDFRRVRATVDLERNADAHPPRLVVRKESPRRARTSSRPGV